MCTLLKYSEVVCKTAEVDTAVGEGIDNKTFIDDV
jgi:hypothetical protein